MDDMVDELSFDEESNWLNRLTVFFQDLLKSTAKPLGEIGHFQAIGSPHAHCG